MIAVKELNEELGTGMVMRTTIFTKKAWNFLKKVGSRKMLKRNICLFFPIYSSCYALDQ